MKADFDDASQLMVPATPEDWAAYHEIREAVLWVARGDLNGYDRNHPDDRRSGNVPLLLVHQGVPVAAARLDLDLPDGWLRRVAVRSTHQRRGHGRVLIRLAVKLARESGCTRVLSNVDRGAVDFYLKAGFEIVDQAPVGAIRMSMAI